MSPAGGDTPGARSTGLVAGGVVAVIAGLGLGTGALVTVGVGLIALPALALGCVWCVAAGLRLRRDIDTVRCLAGDDVEVRIRVAGWPARLGLHRICDLEIDPRMGTARGAAPIRRLRGLAWRLPGVPRGEHVLPAPALRVTDPFGLARRRRTAGWDGPAVLTAVPPAPRVERLAFVERARSHQGVRARQVDGVGDLDRVRDYRPGDPLGRIHWGQTAKRGRLQTKELRLVEGAGGGIDVILSGSHPAGPEFEMAVAAAATVARHLMETGRRVAFTHTGRPPTSLGGTGVSWPIVEAFLTTCAPDESHPTGRAVLTALARPDPPRLVVVVTGPGDPSVAGPLATARAAGVGAAVVWVGDSGGDALAAVSAVAEVVRVRDVPSMAGRLAERYGGEVRRVA